MELSLGLQGRQFLLAAALGLALGLHYDLLRGLRRVFRRLTVVLDLWFALTLLIGSLLFALYVGNGEYRIFMLLGTALGMAVYFLTVSRLILPLSIQFWRILTCPLRLLGRFFGKFLEKMKNFAKNIFSSERKSFTIENRLKMSPFFKEEGTRDASFFTRHGFHHRSGRAVRDRDARHPPAENQRAEIRRRGTV
ncbi:MAG: spore cortex biosynthesis protein YabQ [Oscillospiraceae bacterium]|nr:spore cortex biosynthesis protein YabQ [Oscillospiraceae bacterium]